MAVTKPETASTTGTTANAYADALDFPCWMSGNKTIQLKNTDGANALKYKVWTKFADGGFETAEVGETSLSLGSSVVLKYNDAFYNIRVEVKSSSAGDHATFEINHIGLPS